MSDQALRPHFSFWIIGICILLWNAMGMVNYFMQLNPEMLAGFSESHRTVIENRPAWATIGFAMAVFGGTLAGVFLLLRKSLAYHLFVASLLGTALLMVYTVLVFIETNAGISDILLMALMPLIVAVAFVRYSLRARQKGWIT